MYKIRCQLLYLIILYCVKVSSSSIVLCERTSQLCRNFGFIDSWLQLGSHICHASMCIWVTYIWWDLAACLCFCCIRSHRFWAGTLEVRRVENCWYCGEPKTPKVICGIYRQYITKEFVHTWVYYKWIGHGIIQLIRLDDLCSTYFTPQALMQNSFRRLACVVFAQHN